MSTWQAILITLYALLMIGSVAYLVVQVFHNRKRRRLSRETMRLLDELNMPKAGVWHKHDGGECPVPGDTLVEIPAGTYASFNGRDTMGPMRADSFEWRDDHVRHVRDEIQSYRIMLSHEVEQARRELARRHNKPRND